MKKAVINLGASQYIVSVGDVLSATIQTSGKTKLTTPAMMIIDGEKVSIGDPTIEGSSVELNVQNDQARAEKVTAIRYKAKKRVLKVRGHKQHLVELKVSKIA